MSDENEAEFDDELDDAAEWNRARNREIAARARKNALASNMQQSITRNLRARVLAAESRVRALLAESTKKKTPQKPKPKKAAKKPTKETPMSTRSISALVRSLEAAPKKRKTHARIDPRVSNYLTESFGLEPSQDERSAAAGTTEAESIGHLCKSFGASSVVDLEGKRNAARAAARARQGAT